MSQTQENESAGEGLMAAADGAVTNTTTPGAGTSTAVLDEETAAILDDPETNDWIFKKGSDPRTDSGGDSAAVAAILNDPETNDWLSKNSSKATASIKANAVAVEEILNDPETNDWLSKNSKNNFPPSAARTGQTAVDVILDDPETNDWISKTSKNAVGYALDDAAVAAAETANQQGEVSAERELEVEDPVPAPPGNLTQLARQRPVNRAENQPGAFSADQGHELQRRDNVAFSAVGLHPEGGPDAIAPHHPNEPQPPIASNDGLAQAFPVEEDPVPETEASPFDLEAAERNKATRRKRQFQGMLLVMILFVVILGAVLGTAFRNNNRDSATAGPVLVPTPAPSFSPSQAPSTAPTSALELMVTELPVYAQEKLVDSTTPQWQAMRWLEDHPDLLGMEEWRKTQLFSLATFFYAMEGLNWSPSIQERWMLYSDECLWFNSGTGEFDSITGRWEEYNDFRTGPPPCNDRDEIQYIGLTGLELAEYRPYIPMEIALLTSLELLNFFDCDMTVPLQEFLPSTFFQTNITALVLAGNVFSGTISTEFGLMADSMEDLGFRGNGLSGTIPSEIGLLTKLTTFDPYPLWPASGKLTGTIPTQLGQLTLLDGLSMMLNRLSGPLPSELALLTGLRALYMYENQLSGTLPTELALLTNIDQIHIAENLLTGSISHLLSSWPQLGKAWFHDNSLSGTIPENLSTFLEVLTVDNNNFSGTIPEAICFLGPYHDEAASADGILFDCNDQLCGCCWCPCDTNSTSNDTECRTEAFIPAEDDEEWPGAFPNIPNVLMVNIRTDDFPQETTLKWAKQVGHLWETFNENYLFESDADQVNTFSRPIQPDTNYRLRFFDIDGTCCGLGYGWFTVTNSTPSSHTSNGTVLWQAIGDVFEDSLYGLLDVYISIDSEGHSQFSQMVLPTSSDLVREDENWPGAFPNAPNAISINIQTDDWPQEISWEWSTEVGPDEWKTLDSGFPGDTAGLLSYTMQIEPDTFYRFYVFDSGGDGTCCRHGFGWFSITNSTPSELLNGTVVWEAPGVGFTELVVNLWVDGAGNVHVHTFEPSRDDADWPGAFPTPGNDSNTITINMRADDYPEETTWEWSMEVERNYWVVLDTGSLSDASSLHSRSLQVETATLYRLMVADSAGDGTCCSYGEGWFTITNSTPSSNHEQGTVIWDATGGVFDGRLDVYIQIDSTGSAFLVGEESM